MDKEAVHIIASLAMTSLIRDMGREWDYATIAEEAYKYADAMMNEHAKREKEIKGKEETDE